MSRRTLDHAFARGLARKYKPAPVNLTPREMDILQWMAEGKSDWEIGVILKVSEHLVDTSGSPVSIYPMEIRRTRKNILTNSNGYPDLLSIQKND